MSLGVMTPSCKTACCTHATESRAVLRFFWKGNCSGRGAQTWSHSVRGR
jgi:hypothetical protein